MDHSIPKHIKKKLREFSTEAYERELNIHLEELYLLFNEWKDKKISGGELSHRLYEYNQGASKKLFGKYNTLDANMLVGFAVENGVLTENEIPDELLPYIGRSVKFLHDSNKE